MAGEDREQMTLLLDCLDDYIAADNPVRLVEVFVDELDLTGLGLAALRYSTPRAPEDQSGNQSGTLGTKGRSERANFV